MMTQHTARAAMIPPINNQFVLFGALRFPRFIPAGIGAIAGTTVAFGNGDPQFEHTELLPGFSVPQLSHLITAGCPKTGGTCITRQASRALASVKSPPHCEHVFAEAGLRVPQNGQWMSGPSCAALSVASSDTNFCSDGSSNCT